MNKKIRLLGAIALTAGALAVTPAAGAAAVSGSVGVTGQGETTWRASISQDWDKRWWEGDTGYLRGYWDAG